MSIEFFDTDTRALYFDAYTMGVNYLAKKLRPGDKTPDSMADSSLLHKKRIGVDASVVFHKALGTEEGAGQYTMKPPIPNGEVIDRCTRICGYAKKNEIVLVVSIDGKYHPMKETENAKRGRDRNSAKEKLESLLRCPEISSKKKEAYKLMKSAVTVDEHMLGTAVKVFRDHGFEVYGAPYEMTNYT